MNPALRLPSLAPPAVAPAMIFIAAAAIAVLLMLPAWRSMAEIWWENETYTHGMLVPLASLWLGWRERARLAGLAPRPAPLALLALGGCALGALAGEIAGVNTLRHAAAVGALPSLFVLCFGTAIARVLAFPLGFMVVKKNGSRAEYDSRKLRASLQLSLRKRPVGLEQVDAAVHRIEDKLLSLGLREVASERIGELVMRELRRLDKVAYIRFASVYRSFEDVDEFADAVQELKPRRGR
jgi:transcriptional regulator NrdR